MERLKACDAVIFDFDGVLVDSLPVHVMAWDEAAKELFGVALPDDMRTTIVGRQTRSISQMINERLGHSDVDGLMKMKAKKVSALSTYVKLMPGALNFIRAIEKLGIPYGIASNAPRDFVHGVCHANNLTLAVKLGVEDAGRPKPAPDLFLRAAQLLEIPFTNHKNCIVFEDSLHGIDAAVAAGMVAIGVRTHHGHDELMDHGATLTVMQLDEVAEHALIVK